MSKEAKDAIGYGLAVLFTVIGIVIAVWFSAWAVRSVWHSLFYVSPQQKAAQAAKDAQDAAEWAKDPTNPQVVAKKCEDKGGTPTFSAWDGRVTDCKGVDNSKSVNIEVNQK